MNTTRAEIITIGDELLIGQVINTNQAYIAERLNSVGVYVERMTTVGDNRNDILAAFASAWERFDVVCVTGGLGPTHDDITKDLVCEFFHTHLVRSEEALSSIKAVYERRHFAWSSSAEAQAMVPRGCIVLRNSTGTAPGMLFLSDADGDTKFFVAMPGVPFEMKSIMDEEFIPRLAQAHLGTVVRHRTLKTTGIAESMLAAELGNIEDILGRDPATTLAFLPNPLGTKLRITVREATPESAEEKINATETRIRARAEKYIYSADEKELEDVIGGLLAERKMTLAVAESCTGGMIANRITNVPGSSAYFMRGFVTYSNESKTELLGVGPGILEAHGAVSREVAIAMAYGARNRAQVDVALSTTGIAGPAGGSPEKPVGLVWIGYADAEGSLALKFNFGDNRLRFKERTSQAALELLRRKLLKLGER
ncbi:MAG TPA: competence/damage-inducible protein A [Bacteroidota bacterium]|nr:competence/damage-inducible protein A [Bacteroidota bacterium]